MITVLTPTYNRVHTLPRLHASLLMQTSKRFEWILVDDGSTDSTRLWFESNVVNSRLAARYVFQKNGGKHVALNKGVAVASFGWILIVDSDDALTSDAISTLLRDLEKHENDELVGLCYRRAYFNSEVVGTAVRSTEPRFFHPTKLAQIVKGDLAYVFRKDVMSLHPFPVIEGETFVPELYIWNKIGDEGNILVFLSKAIYLCEYLRDGYTVNFRANLRKNPRGFGVFYRSQIMRDPSVFNKVKYATRTVQCFFYSLIRSFKQ